MTTVADVGTEIGKKSELDLLVDEIIKTQNAIGDIQSSFNKLEVSLLIQISRRTFLYSTKCICSESNESGIC